MERHSQEWQISRQQKGGMQIGRGTSKGSGSGGASGAGGWTCGCDQKGLQAGQVVGTDGVRLMEGMSELLETVGLLSDLAKMCLS